MLRDLRDFAHCIQRESHTAEEYHNNYEPATNVTLKKNPDDGNLVSLDFYITDEDIVDFMEERLHTMLDENFVENHYYLACALFNAYRTDLPEELQQYGFPIGSRLIDSEFATTELDARDVLDRQQYPDED